MSSKFLQNTVERPDIASYSISARTTSGQWLPLLDPTLPGSHTGFYYHQSSVLEP